MDPVLTTKLRALDRHAASTFDTVKGVVMRAPRYAAAWDGRAPSDDDVRELIESLPPGCAPANKELLAIDSGGGSGDDGDGTTIGVVSLVRHWPDARTAHVGLLLLAEPYQGRGLGSAAWAALESRLQAGATLARVRVAVREADAPGRRFWQRLGFNATGESVSGFGAGGAVLLLLAKPLRAA